MAGNLWLPPPITLEQYSNNISEYIDGLYHHFTCDFVTSKPSCGAFNFDLKRGPCADGREWTFWHLVTEGRDEDARKLDYQRCERIRWPRAIIDAVGSQHLYFWAARRGSDRYRVIALPDFSYIVVLADRKTKLMLWTAYPIQYERRKDQLRGEWTGGKLATPW